MKTAWLLVSCLALVSGLPIRKPPWPSPSPSSTVSMDTIPAREEVVIPPKQLPKPPVSPPQLTKRSPFFGFHFRYYWPGAVRTPVIRYSPYRGYYKRKRRRSEGSSHIIRQEETHDDKTQVIEKRNMNGLLEAVRGIMTIPTTTSTTQRLTSTKTAGTRTITGTTVKETFTSTTIITVTTTYMPTTIITSRRGRSSGKSSKPTSTTTEEERTKTVTVYPTEVHTIITPVPSGVQTVTVVSTATLMVTTGVNSGDAAPTSESRGRRYGQPTGFSTTTAYTITPVRSMPPPITRLIPTTKVTTTPSMTITSAPQNTNGPAGGGGLVQNSSQRNSNTTATSTVSSSQSCLCATTPSPQPKKNGNVFVGEKEEEKVPSHPIRPWRRWLGVFPWWVESSIDKILTTHRPSHHQQTPHNPLQASSTGLPLKRGIEEKIGEKMDLPKVDGWQPPCPCKTPENPDKNEDRKSPPARPYYRKRVTDQREKDPDPVRGNVRKREKRWSG
ncbi:hypothetical protein TWF281_000181 [Arthrobotrys megalospora]